MAKQKPKSNPAHLSRTHQDYWASRVYFPEWTRGGERRALADFSIRIAWKGRRETFPLNTANRTVAGAKARDIYVSLSSPTGGWDATLKLYKPKPTVSEKIATVGEVIAEAGKIATEVRQITLAAYAAALRRLAADIGQVKGPDATAKFAYMRPEFAEYRAKVDAVSVAVLTAGAVKEWKERQVAAKKLPKERKATKISCDTIIRSAAALFGEKLRGVLATRLKLPNPLPMAGVSYGKSTNRFESKVNPSWLFAKAREELEAQHPEQFKALTLCLLAGLRRSEVDTLSWAQLDLDAGLISICTTDYFTPKSEESTRKINLSPMAIDVMRTFKAGAEPDPVFVLKGADAKPGARYKFYRADAPPWRTWRNLTTWLAAHGIEDQKAIHALRKHAGSLIYAAHGIEAARGFLGHGDIATTAASYLNQGQSITVNLVPVVDEVAAAKKKA